MDGHFFSLVFCLPKKKAVYKVFLSGQTMTKAAPKESRTSSATKLLLFRLKVQ